jgi:oxygen-dependent protoporphyrinogen oxidase
MNTERDDLEARRLQPAGPPPRIAIIGGGLAGLAAAFRLSELARESNRKVDVTLFEASDRLGGAIETVRENGYTIERGADSFLTKPAIVKLVEQLGLSESLIPTDARYRGALVLRGGKTYPVPDGFGLMVPSKMIPVLASPLLSVKGKLRLLSEVFVPARRDGADETLSSFVRRRLGDEAFERLVQPLVSGIYTADPDKLSLKATLPRFIEMEQRHGSLIRASLASGGRQSPENAASGNATGARYGLFAGLKNGMSELFDALSRRVEENVHVVKNACVERVRREGDRWRVELQPTGRRAGGFEGGVQENFDALIIATPAYRAASFLENVDGILASELRAIPYASSAVVVTGHRLDEISHPLKSFGLVIPTVEKRDVIAVSFSSRKFPNRAPEGHVLLRTFVGGAMRPEMLEHSDDELIAIVRKELASLLGVSDQPDVTLVTRYENAMPQYHVGHIERVQRIEAELAKYPGLELTGSAYRGVGMPDVVADAERAAERIFASRS